MCVYCTGGRVQDMVDMLHTNADHFSMTLSKLAMHVHYISGLVQDTADIAVYSQAVSTAQVDLYKTWLTCSTLVLATSAPH